MWEGPTTQPIELGVFTSVSISPDTTKVACGTNKGWIYVFSVETGEQLKGFPAHELAINQIKWAYDSKYVLACSDDKMLSFTDAETEKKVTDFFEFNAEALCCDIYGCGYRIVAAGADLMIRLYVPGLEYPVNEVLAHTNKIYSICFSPCGKYIMSASRDGLIRIWKDQHLMLLRTLDSNQVPRASFPKAYNAIFSPNGKFVLAVFSDKKARMFKVSNGTLAMTLDGYVGNPKANSMFFIAKKGDPSKTNELILTDADGGITSFDIINEKINWDYDTQQDPIIDIDKDVQYLCVVESPSKQVKILHRVK